MIRCASSALFAALLALAGVATTADRADAQVVYYSYYYPGAGYYNSVVPVGVYPATAAPQTSYSYYTPPNAALYTPVRAWDGGWTVNGYTSPAIPYYNDYRATSFPFRR